MSDQTPNGALELRNVAIGLGREPLIGRLALTVAPGSVATVMGPSGSGKSSLLAYIAGFLDTRVFRAEGAVLLDGVDVAALRPERRRIGLLFQDDLLFPHLSVAGNLLFGVPAQIRDKAERHRFVEQALADADLSGFGERDPATLSGGQRARIALMRVLLSQPRALLLDEPFSKLDSELRAAFREMIFAQARRRALPVLMVTHDPQDAQAAGGDVLRLA
ncbi:ATP-binding cassette domain-containing protein [Bosea sp. PAMC 26642]|uniref:ATP-binding cassette domain-containing protein n=1 Tax=Bosea sp. (strain PAMC 26642) TaxID=1792307 RepID=UPI0007701287|nr:ATP-binding cassette domain-containing protein [Bosea sp. PAMC 26642]AMJ63211.1 ABC transporter ATP-binding protein [Bosea sp. PAMC 26642]